jgi:hypothetical protein
MGHEIVTVISMAEKILITCDFDTQSEEKTAVLLGALARYGLGDAIDLQADGKNSAITITDNAGQSSQNTVFVSPLYLGHLIKRLKAMSEPPQTQAQLHFSCHTLDLIDACLHTPAKKSIRLTEKEAALIQILHDAQGEPIEGAELLKSIWNYAQDTETHTVATHIYRLRQKIETDPNDPKLVITDGTGYRLAL